MKNSLNKSHLSNHSIEGKKIGLVKSQWNIEITDKLFNGCYKTLESHGAKKKDIYTLEVPGSFELIFGAKNILSRAELDAVIVIGSIIKGETPHFEFISNAVCHGIKDLNILFDIPFILCVLTDLNQQQAYDRSGGKMGNKGVDCALATIELIKNLS